MMLVWRRSLGGSGGGGGDGGAAARASSALGAAVMRAMTPGVSGAATASSSTPAAPHRRAFGSVRFRDLVTTDVVAGKGGDGSRGFIHLGFMRRRPDGGHGGHGGDVILHATHNCRMFAKHGLHRARDGGNGGKRNCRGHNGKNLIIKVPLGTQVTEIDAYRTDNGEVRIRDQSKKGRLLVDLDKEGQRLLVAKGGRGGRGNAAQMFMSNTHFPKVDEEQANGKPGEFKRLRLVLKSIADVGLVGYPNAGKSTLLRAISRATPKVAPYPFTTLHPNIGMVEFSDFEQISVADIPGLVDGAHENCGLGHAFLRHIERTKVLLYVVDVVAANTEDRSASPGEDLAALVRELELYMPGLSQRPSLVIANKMDKLAAEKKDKVIEELMMSMPSSSRGILGASAMRGGGVRELVSELRKLVFEVSGRGSGTLETDSAAAAEDDSEDISERCSVHAAVEEEEEEVEEEEDEDEEGEEAKGEYDGEPVGQTMPKPLTSTR